MQAEQNYICSHAKYYVGDETITTIYEAVGAAAQSIIDEDAGNIHGVPATAQSMVDRAVLAVTPSMIDEDGNIHNMPAVICRHCGEPTNGFAHGICKKCYIPYWQRVGHPPPEHPTSKNVESIHKLSDGGHHSASKRKATCRVPTRKERREANIIAITLQQQQWRDTNIPKQGSEACRIKQSCAIQGVSLENWDGFAVESKYCPKFNEACKERNREKYGRRCFVCGKTEAENNGRKLSVHHVDMNKNQGCDSVWQLVPLCSKHHGGSHNDTWQARIEYLLNNVW